MSVNQFALIFFVGAVVAHAIGIVLGRYWRFDEWKPVLSIGVTCLFAGGGTARYEVSRAIDAAVERGVMPTLDGVVVAGPLLIAGVAAAWLGVLICGVVVTQTLRINRQQKAAEAAAPAPKPPKEGALGRCPNCEKTILQSAPECPHCKALFGEGSAWKIEPL